MWRATFVALATAAVVGAAVWVLFGSRLLVVRSVVVTGTHLVPRSEVLAVAGVEPGTPLIRVNTAQVAARIDTIRQVRSALVSRSWPDRVVIVVRERTAALALAAPGGGYDLVDSGWRGRAVGRQPSRGPAALSDRGPRHLAARRSGSGRGRRRTRRTAAWLRHSVASVTAPDPDQVTLRLADGITVLWGGTDRAGAKATELAVLMPDSHALLRCERTGVRADQVMGSDARDPPIRDTLTGSRVVS